MNNPVHTYEVLLIDDDPDFSMLISKYLEQHSMRLSFAGDGASGLSKLREKQYDLLLLDIFLPDINGIEVLRLIRVESQVPVVMLSAHDEETDRIVALEMGADDYVPKKYSARELLARMRAVLRRRGPPEQPEPIPAEVLRLRDLELDPDSMEVTVAGLPILLSHNEFRLLQLLLSNAGRAFSRNDLLEQLPGKDLEIYDRSVDSLIYSLRLKLGDDPKDPKYIKTIRGVGYALLK